MRRKRNWILAVTAVAGILILGGAGWLWLWGQRDVIVVVQSFHPPICTQDVVSPECGDGMITAETEAGEERQYKYPSNVRVESSNGLSNVTALKRGTKLLLTVSGRNQEILRIQTVD